MIIGSVEAHICKSKYLKTLAYKLRLTYLGLIYFVSFWMVVRIADVQKLLLVIGEEGQVWNELLFKYCSEIDLNQTDPYASPPGLALSQWSAMYERDRWIELAPKSLP